MKIFCSSTLEKFFQESKQGELTLAKLESWLDALEHSPGEACMPGQFENFRFPDTARPGGLGINWVGFRINDAGRLIGAVVNVPGVGLCFFALDLTETHDYQKTLVEKPSLRQGYLQEITTFLSQGGAIAAASSSSSSSSAASGTSADTSHSFKRMVQHARTWLSPDMTQLELMDLPIHQGVICFAPPGAGKTLIAVQRAIALAQQGLTVLVCVPTPLLAQSLIKEFAEQGVADWVKVRTFEDVLKSSGMPQGQGLVDFKFFKQWCAERPKILDKQNSQKRTLFEAALTAGESLLWQEFEYVFMQTWDWRSPSDAHLSESQYCGLGAKESRIPEAQRVNIYKSVFVPFLADIKDDSTLYYPPLVAYTLSLTEPSAALKFDALVLDEVQKVHPWVSTCFLKLLKNPLSAGQFFICGDAHQGVECQQLRMASTLTSYLEGQGATFSIHHLSVNHRSSKAVTRLALQARAVEKELLGSMEKATHQCAAVDEDAPEGSVEVLSYDAKLKQRIELDAEAYVLIPDESCREAAVKSWPAGQVVTLREFSGLSAKTVVMYGFGDYFKNELGEIGAFFADKSLPSWDEQSAFSRRGINYEQRACLQSIYTAASRAMVSLYIIDSRPGFLNKIVANSCMGMPVAAAGAAAGAAAPAAAAQTSTPKEWFERAHKDFKNGLVEQAKSILEDQVKIGIDAYHKIKVFQDSNGIAKVFSFPFDSYLPYKLDAYPLAPRTPFADAQSKRTESNSPPPVDGAPVSPSSVVLASFGAPPKYPSQSANVSAALPQASAAGGGGAQAGSISPSPVAGQISTQKARFIGAYLKGLDADRAPPPKCDLTEKEQKWVDSFSPTENNLKTLLAMEDRGKDLRSTLLFVAEVGLSKESIFIKFVAAGKIKLFLSTISQFDFLDKISSIGLNHLCRSDANLNMSLANILCCTPEGMYLLRENKDLAAKISAEALASKRGGYSPLFWLCATENGIALLRENKDLAAKIDIVVLNDVKWGMSAAYRLCAAENGRALLRENKDLVDKITSQGLNTTLLPKLFKDKAGLSALNLLCAADNGRALLRENPKLVDKITADGLNAPTSAGGKSALFFLCVNPDGIAILIENPKLVDKITADGLNARTSAGGKSALYFLANTEEGKLLIAGNIELAKKISCSDFDRIFPGTDGESVECRLKRYRENTQDVLSIGSMFALTQTPPSPSKNPPSSVP